MLVRINKLLSQAGVASRRKADELIKEGNVLLNGKPLKVPGAIIDTAKDRLDVCGERIELKSSKKYLYFLLNKPAGHISTVGDTHDRRTIMDLLPKAKGLFPVGRLDKDTTGLIIITNDGELAHRLMHPRYEIEKIYDVEIKSRLADKDRLRLEQGVDIGDGRPSCLKVLSVRTVKARTRIRLEIHEGRKRQIRRTFEELGYKITDLKRIEYGGLKIDIKEGSYRELREQEVTFLKKKVGLL